MNLLDGALRSESMLCLRLIFWSSIKERKSSEQENFVDAYTISVKGIPKHSDMDGLTEWL